MRGLLKILSSSIMFAFFLLGNASALTLEKQIVRDWEVYCNDDRYCIASTTGQTESGKEMRFKLERSYEPNAKIYVTSAPRGDDLALGMQVEIEVEGHDYRAFGPVTKIYSNNEMAFVGPHDRKLVRKLREGRFATVTIAFGGNTGTLTYNLSLQGVSSALAFMDIVQGRLDREDAVIVSGGEALSSVSDYNFSAAIGPKVDTKALANAPKDPEEGIDYGNEDQVTANSNPSAEPNEESGLGSVEVIYEEARLPDAVTIYGYRTLDCDLSSTVPAFGAQEINLEPGVFLYFVPCKMADVNVSHYGVMLTGAPQGNLLAYQVPAGDGNRADTIINPTWDKNLKAMTAYQYYSPGYDCGLREIHNYDFQSEQFFLSQVQEKEKCDGVQTPVEQYPITWDGEGG